MPHVAPLSTWLFRLQMAAALAVAGEGLFWQGLSATTPLAGLAVAALYVALAALGLDWLARWPDPSPTDWLLVGGIFGVLHSALIATTLTLSLPLSLAVYGLGVGSLICLAAMTAVLGEPRLGNRLLTLGIAAGLGLLAGLWTFALPQTELTDIPWTVPDRALVMALAGPGFLGLLALASLGLADHVSAGAARLSGRERAGTLLVLGAATIWRLTSGALTASGLVSALLLLSLLGGMLWFRGRLAANQGGLSAEPPARPRLSWHMLTLSVLALGYGLGYGLAVDERAANAVFLVVLAWGVIWLPLVSTQLGFRAFVQLVDEELYS